MAAGTGETGPPVSSITRFAKSKSTRANHRPVHKQTAGRPPSLPENRQGIVGQAKAPEWPPTETSDNRFTFLMKHLHHENETRSKKAYVSDRQESNPHHFRIKPVTN
jgi:hypothetical protein